MLTFLNLALISLHVLLFCLHPPFTHSYYVFNFCFFFFFFFLSEFCLLHLNSVLLSHHHVSCFEVLNHFIKSFEFIAICLLCFHGSIFLEKIFVWDVLFLFLSDFSLEICCIDLQLVLSITCYWVKGVLQPAICRKQLGQWNEQVVKLLWPRICVCVCVCVCIKRKRKGETERRRHTYCFSLSVSSATTEMLII